MHVLKLLNQTNIKLSPIFPALTARARTRTHIYTYLISSFLSNYFLNYQQHHLGFIRSLFL
jgi:hypothetical protein